MDRSVDRADLDLDQAGAEIQHRWFVWTAAGISVHPITWAGGEGEPEVAPRSLCWRASRPNAHVDVVLHADGWVETAVRRPDATVTTHATAEVDCVEEFGLLLERVVDLITWSGPDSSRKPSDSTHPAGPQRASGWVLGFDGERIGP